MGGSPSGGQSSADLRQKRMARRQTGIANQMGAMANSADVMGLAGAGLTDAEQMQLDTIGLGLDRAQQGITQNVRNEATARGMFSSGGAIAEEAGQLAGLDTFMAQQQADIYGQAQQRQFQGLGMRSGLLGQAMGGYGQAGQAWGGVAASQRQREQQQQQNTMGNVMGIARLGAGIMTGGTSELGYRAMGGN